VVTSVSITAQADLPVDTRTPAARRQTQDRIVGEMQERDASASAKDEVASRLATALGIDLADIRRRRLLHLMNPREVSELAAHGVDFQLHSHRHRSPLDRDAYVREIDDNRDRIVSWTGVEPRHFCYPSGVCMPSFGEWLHAEGVLSATTCEPGMSSAVANRFQLPRLLDHSEMTDIEFESWLAGVGEFLPRRTVGFHPVDRDGRLIVDRAPATGSPIAAAEYAPAQSSP
jgi:hypothetical protein